MWIHVYSLLLLPFFCLFRDQTLAVYWRLNYYSHTFPTSHTQFYSFQRYLSDWDPDSNLLFKMPTTVCLSQLWGDHFCIIVLWHIYYRAEYFEVLCLCVWDCIVHFFRELFSVRLLLYIYEYTFVCLSFFNKIQSLNLNIGFYEIRISTLKPGLFFLTVSRGRLYSYRFFFNCR